MPLDESLEKSAVVDLDQPARGLSNRTVATAVTLAFLTANLLFALRLTPIPALIVIAGCVGTWRLVASSPRSGVILAAPLRLRALAVCLLVALVLCLLGGQAHVFFANVDWLTRDAVLADLSRTWSIPAYVEHGTRFLLRSPVGLFMIPAVVGHALSLYAAHLVLLAQDTLIVGGILYLMRAAGSGWFTVATVLLWGSFTGLQRLIPPLLYHQPWSDVLAMPVIPLDVFFPYGIYASSITHLFWGPGTALPGWWIAVLLILYAEAEIDLALVAGSVGALVLWSPLAVVTAVPSVFARFRLPAWIGEARTWLGLAAALCFLPIAIYLVLAAGSVEHYLLATNGEFPVFYPAFLLAELPAAIFVACNIKRLRKPLRGLFWINLAVLAALPCYRFGPANDLLEKCSCAAVAVVAFCMGEVLFGSDRPGMVGKTIGVFIVAIGAIIGVGEVDRALVTPSYPVSDCTLIQASKILDLHQPPNYLVRPEAVPRWLVSQPRTWPAQGAARGCWPTFPLMVQMPPAANLRSLAQATHNTHYVAP